MKRLIYISDNRYYVDDEGNWYSEGVFPKEIQEVFSDVDEWVFYGRLEHLAAHKNKYLIEKGNNINQIRFVGLWNRKSGAKALLMSIIQQIRILKKEIEKSDVVYLKFNYFSSYLSTLIPTTWKKYTISHMVGDLDCIQYIYKNPLIKIVVAARRILYRRAANRLNLQIFVSEKLKNKYACQRENAIAICENRIKLRQITDKHYDDDSGTKLLFVGRLSKEKGVELLIQALANTPDVKLSIVGDGIERDKLKKLTEELNLENRVEFLGNVKWGTDLFSVVKNSDCLVLPSYSEGLPLVLVEAMSFGVPVIATDVGGIPEIVDDGVNGFLCKSGDVESLMETIVKFEKSDKNSLSKNALQTARTYSLDSMNTKLANALKDNGYDFNNVGR